MRLFLRLSCVIAASLHLCLAAASSDAPKPNFIIIYADDLGYGDLGCYGQKRIKTPNLDRLAAGGMRFTDFYSAAAVCTPSRAALLTGCYPQRVGLGVSPNLRDDQLTTNSVIYAESPVGLNPDEVTLPELLKPLGYATACIGKWHLGHHAAFLPTRQGFDEYLGIPYSNDMKPTVLMRGEEVIEPDVDQSTLTERYTSESIRFITENKGRSFFLYLPHAMPHTPLHASARFKGRSVAGLYGDVVECIDWSAGEILATLESLGIADRTIVIFSSDNGPWLIRGEHGGIATPLRSGKGATYEGGMRVPCIMRWPGKIPAGSTCGEVASTIDLLPTLVRLAGGQPPADRVIDGRDIYPLMSGSPGASSPHEAFFFYRLNELQAVRSGPWKLRLQTKWSSDDPYRRVACPEAVVPEALYNLEADIGEQKSVLKEHPDIAKRLREFARQAREDLGDEATGSKGKGVRPVGYVDEPITSAPTHRFHRQGD